MLDHQRGPCVLSSETVFSIGYLFRRREDYAGGFAIINHGEARKLII